MEQDLEFLSDVSPLLFQPPQISVHFSSIQGLEGRSTNPVSLLLDALQKPEADLGLELPSLLEWRHVEEGKVDHVVLGRGKPGGIWQVRIWYHMELGKWVYEHMARARIGGILLVGKRWYMGIVKMGMYGTYTAFGIWQVAELQSLYLVQQ